MSKIQPGDQNRPAGPSDSDRPEVSVYIRLFDSLLELLNKMIYSLQVSHYSIQTKQPSVQPFRHSLTLSIIDLSAWFSHCLLSCT